LDTRLSYAVVLTLIRSCRMNDYVRTECQQVCLEIL
jgi:hypothetical protein